MQKNSKEYFKTILNGKTVYVVFQFGENFELLCLDGNAPKRTYKGFDLWYEFKKNHDLEPVIQYEYEMASTEYDRRIHEWHQTMT